MRQCMDVPNIQLRIKKIQGQLNAISKMVEEDVPCEDILIQINAAKSAMHKVGKFNRNSDITKNMKLIEWMKNEILMSVSELFNILFKGVRSADEGLQDVLANIIMITYLLAKRLGISFNEIDYKIKEKISLGIKEDHSIEKWYGDLTNLKNHIENRE